MSANIACPCCSSMLPRCAACLPPAPVHAALSVTDERRQQVLFVVPNYYASGVTPCHERCMPASPPPLPATLLLCASHMALPSCTAARAAYPYLLPRPTPARHAGVKMFALQAEATNSQLGSWGGLRGVKLCTFPTYYANDMLRSQYDADLVEVPDPAAQLARMQAGDCVTGAWLPACLPAVLRCCRPACRLARRAAELAGWPLRAGR